jgi:hypothetical protein
MKENISFAEGYNQCLEDVLTFIEINERGQMDGKSRAAILNFINSKMLQNANRLHQSVEPLNNENY